MNPIRVLLLCLCLGLSAVSGTVMAAEEGEAVVDDVQYVELKPMVTNFGTPNDLHFMKAEVTIQVASSDSVHDVNAHMPQIRDALMFLFSGQSKDELQTVTAQQDLAQKALEKIRELMAQEQVDPQQISDVFFTSLVVQ